MQLGHRCFYVTVELPGVLGFDLGLQPLELSHDLVHLLLWEIFAKLHTDFFVRLEQVTNRLNCLLDVVANRQVFEQLRLLRHVTDGHAFGEACDAFKFLVLTGHDPHQGRLSSTVLTDDANLGAIVEHQADVVQDGLLVIVALSELLDGKDGLVAHGGKQLTDAQIGFYTRQAPICIQQRFRPTLSAVCRL